jgi:pimeloyl-ACP methyl ester carboxylesterase
MQVDGIEVFVEGAVEGAETLVMVHGWPDTHRLWDGQAAFFGTQYRCVRFTLPGFDIDKPRRAYSLDEIVTTLRKVVEAVSPGRPVILMLHDWGCIFGYEFYMRYPSLVSKIVGVDIGDANSPAHLRSLSVMARLGVVFYQGWLAIAWLLGGWLGDKMTLAMAGLLKAPSERRFISSAMNFPYYITWTGAYGSYRRILRFEPACPLMYVYGTRKPFMFHSPEWAQEQARKPGNRVLALPAGHWVMKNQPAEFNAAVKDWLAANG